jgi:hypothetical protein
MEDNVQRMNAHQPDMLNLDTGQGTFSLWDALDLAFHEDYPPDILKSLDDTFTNMDIKTQATTLHTIGEFGRRLPDGPKRGVIAYFLAKQLGHSHPDVRVTAVEAVGILSKQALAEDLTSKLTSDENMHVRIASAEALGELTLSMTLHAFENALNDPSWQVRATIIQTLGNLSEHLIINPLKIAVDDQDFSVRSAAIHVLGTFKGCLKTDYLTSIAQGEKNDWLIRDAAVTALERAGEYGLSKPLRIKLNLELETESNLVEEEVATFYLPEEVHPLTHETLPPTSQPYRKKEEIDTHQQQTEDVSATLDDNTLHHLPGKKRKRRIFPVIGPKKVKENKKDTPRKTGLEERVACASHHFKKSGSEIFSRTKGIMVLLCMVLFLFFFIIIPTFHSYASDAQIDWSSGLSFPAASPAALQIDVTAHKHDDARLVITAQPGSVASGQRSSISITAINTGLTIWTDTGDYRLTCSTNNIWEIGCIETSNMVISHPVLYNRGTYTFTISFIAPFIKGTYILQWTMHHDGAPFGSTIDIKLHVF